jgi:TonB family protein
MAILKGWEGETVVRISVDSSGGIESFEMLQSSGFSTLDEAVLKVLPQWHFEKGRARVMDVPFKFLLKSEK